MKYDEWADKQRKERGDTVEVGSKRLRKVNPKYVDNQKSHSNTSIAQNNINNEIESNAVSSKEVQVERHGENGSSPATQRLVKTSTMNNINDTTSVNNAPSESLPSTSRSTSPLLVNDPPAPPATVIAAAESQPTESAVSSLHPPGVPEKKSNMAAADGNKSDVPLTKSNKKEDGIGIGNITKSKERTIMLKNVDATDTTPPPSWPDKIACRKDIRRIDENGEWIECALCLGTGRTNGIISMKP